MRRFIPKDDYYMRCGKYYISKWSYSKDKKHCTIFFDCEEWADKTNNFISVEYDERFHYWYFHFGMPILALTWHQMGLSLEISSAEEGKNRVEFFIKKFDKLAAFI